MKDAKAMNSGFQLRKKMKVPVYGVPANPLRLARRLGSIGGENNESHE
jgi:hypothetical protein